MRLFVAINCPQQVRETVWAAAAPFRDSKFPIRWVEKDLIHLTVKFLGEVARQRVEEITRVLYEIGRANGTFSLGILGFGAFPTPSRARVVWAGCEPAKELELLQHEIEDALGALGFAPEGKPFRPHLTLGRGKRDGTGNQMRGLAELIETTELCEEMAVTSIDLMESHPGPKGARYEKIFTAELGH